MRPSTILFVGVLLFPAVAGAQSAVRPGQYEYTIEMNLGIPTDASKAVLDAAGFQNQKKLECLTADELKGDIAKLMADELASDDDCKISNVKTTENKLTFTTTCVGDVQMVMSTEMTFGTDSFSGVTKGKDNEGRVITMKVGARRVGECK
jgi:ribosomal protein S13